MGRQKDYILRTERGLNMNLTNDEEYEMLVEPEEPAPYPDIPAKAPGMLMKCKEDFGVNDVGEEEMEQTDKERVMLPAENLGLDFASMPTKVIGGELIEIPNNAEEEAINEYIQEEILMKVEPNQKEEVLQDAVKTAKGEEPGRLV
jgi:hypothetical protein